MSEDTRVDVDGTSVSCLHYINGARVGSAQSFSDHSPLDWEWQLASIARGDAATADHAVAAASAAFPSQSHCRALIARLVSLRYWGNPR